MHKFHTISAVLGILLFVWLLVHIGLEELWTDLTTLGWGLIPLVLIEGVADLFHTAGWRRCLSEPYRSLPFFHIFRIRLSGFAVNHLTPTAAMGGEVAKGALLAMEQSGAGAVTGVVVGKLSYALAQLGFVVIGSILLLGGVPLPPGVRAAMLAGSVLLALGISAFLLIQQQGKLGSLVRWLARRRLGGDWMAKAAARLTEIDDHLKSFYRHYPGDLVRSVIWHVLGMACGILQSWFFFYLLVDHPSWHIAAGVWFLGSWLDLLGFAIPTNVGVLEATRVLAFRAMGQSAALGLTYGVALRLEQLFWAGAGLVCYWTLIADRRRPNPEEARQC